MRTDIPIAIIIVMALLIYGTAVTVVDWLALPLVAVNYDGECQWMQVPASHGVERLDCPDVLPDRYDRIFVFTE